jgi:maltose alpha-D-glucosyltransferase/alpha-amylase
MKKSILFLLAVFSAVASYAQPMGRGPQDWPNFKRYEEKNAALTQAPLLVLMGDSITDFWYDNDPDFFEKNNFAGRGISGQTASQMLTRFKQDVINLGPKAVAIMCGTNDLCQNLASQAYYPDQTIYDNTVAMCELAEDAGIKVLLCSITPCAHYMILPDIDAGSIIEAFNARLKAYADTQENVTYVDYFTPLANAEKGLDDDSTYDGIHPAVNIYDDMERILVDGLQKALKLDQASFYTLPSDEADRRKAAADQERREKNMPMSFSDMVQMLSRMRMGAQAQKPKHPSWLSEAVFYQIYPSSFQDSDGDGYGDLKGIQSRLDYIRSIGVTAIWLNPVYVSGFTDGGYDIIDFYRVDPRFGCNDDLIELVQQAHARGIKIVMDLVAGHSSDQCEWFLQSREGDNLRYSDYYIWPSFKPEEQSASPADSNDPDYAALMSAHLSLTRKFVATDAPRGPYYIKNFYDTQPALNFGFAAPDPTHPWEQAVDAPGPMSMRRELKNIISFWMDKGVDGFRVDMAASLVKNDPDKAATIRLWNQDFVPWFEAEYPEGILIAEWFNPAQSVAQAGFDLDFFCHDGQYNYSSLFFFNRGFGPAGSAKPYFAKAGEGELKTWYDLYTYQYDAVQGHGYVCMPSGNHDFNRVCTEGRTTPDELKVAMTFFLTMPGVPFIYYGDEIGLKQNPNAPSTDGSGFRAGCRIPMLWDGSANGGFSTAPIEKIYIPQDPDPNRMTVEKEENDPASLLNYVRTLLQLRKEVKALGADGAWRLVSSLDQPYPMVYERTLGDERCYVVLNPSGKQVTVTLPGASSKPVLIGGNYKKCTYKQTKKGDVITLSPVSAAIYQF